MLKWIYTIEMSSNYHAAKSFTLTQPLACGIVALKKFDHNQFMSKYANMITLTISSHLTHIIMFSRATLQGL